MFKRVKSVTVENGLVSKSSLVLSSYLKMRLILKICLYIFFQEREWVMEEITKYPNIGLSIGLALV